MEHVAKELKMTPEEVRKVNLYKNGQVCSLLFALLRLTYLLEKFNDLAEIFEVLQADEIVLTFECNSASTMNIKILLS